MQAGLSSQGLFQRSLLTILLIALLNVPALAGGADLDARARLLAERLESELGRFQESTAEFGGLEVIHRQEHWYRPWQENAIVTAMDQVLDASDDLLLTELLDPRGQLAAVNAHAGSGAPLASGDLYIEDFSKRSWFRALTQAGTEITQRLDGPLRDPDVARVYGEEFNPCIRVTVPLHAQGKVVALLSHCYRSDVLAELLDLALRDGDERLPGELALFDGRGRLIAGRDPQSGGGDAHTSRAFTMEMAGGPNWTLRAFQPVERSLVESLAALLPSLGLLPGLAFGLSACLIVCLLLLVRLRLFRSPEERPATPPRKVAPKPASIPHRTLATAEKAWDILNAALGAMLATVHTLAGGSEELADGSLNPLVAEGPGSTLGALRRVSGMRELFGGLERHVANCVAPGSVSADLRGAVELFGRIGGQMEKLVEPLLETERRLRMLPRVSLRGPGEKHSYTELTGNLHSLMGVMSALQSGLARLPQRALRDEWSAAEDSTRSWQEAVAEIQDLLLLLAGQVGATCKLLDLLPVSTDPVVEVEDISAKVMGASASPTSIGQTPRRAEAETARKAVASAGGRSFEILGRGTETAQAASTAMDEPGSARLPSR